VLPGTAEKEDPIDHLSWVSRIGISAAERPVMEEILDGAEALARLAKEKAGSEEPIRTVAPVSNRMRPGTREMRSKLAESGKLLKSAPSVKGNYFKVASILE